MCLYRRQDTHWMARLQSTQMESKRLNEETAKEVTNIASRKTSRHDQPLMLAKRHVKRLTRRNVTQENGVGVH